MCGMIFHQSLNHVVANHFRLEACFMTSRTQQGCKGRSRFSRKLVRYISYLSSIKPEINSRQSNKNGRFFRKTSHTRCTQTPPRACINHNDTFLFELRAHTGFHRRPCRWLIYKAGSHAITKILAFPWPVYRAIRFSRMFRFCCRNVFSENVPCADKYLTPDGYLYFHLILLADLCLVIGKTVEETILVSACAP